jgi:hypothetical protein
MCPLELLEVADQAVVLGVRDHRCVENVVPVVVVADLFAKRFNPGPDVS